jgi:hypothetical protein
MYAEQTQATRELPKWSKICAVMVLPDEGDPLDIRYRGATDKQDVVLHNDGYTSVGVTATR